MKSIENIFFAVVLFTSTFCFSQEITVNQNAWGYEFKKGEQELNWKQLLKDTESHTKSYNLIKRARSQNTLSTIFGFAGGAFVGYPLGQAIADGETNWVLAIVGGALITVAIPLSSRSTKNLKEGVSKYNQSLRTSYHKHFQPRVHLIGNAQGVGLSLSF